MKNSRELYIIVIYGKCCIPLKYKEVAMMKSKILILLLVCALTLGSTSCKIVINTGGDASSQSSSGQASQNDTSEISSKPEEISEPEPSNTDVEASSVVSAVTGEQDPDDWNPLVIQRQALLDENSMCGVAYIGYVKYDANDLDENRTYINSLLKSTGYWDDFEFLQDLPSDRYVGTLDGTELYLIIPFDTKAKVNVNHWKVDESNGFVGEADAILYTFDNGAPFLLKCNASDIIPDTQVLILDSNGKKLEYTPRISLMDGSVETVANNQYLVDFTIRG